MAAADYDRLICELETALPSGSPMQFQVIELARLIKEQAEEILKLQSVVDQAIDLLRKFPEDSLGRTECPGGGLQSNLYARIGELHRQAHSKAHRITD